MERIDMPNLDVAAAISLLDNHGYKTLCPLNLSRTPITPEFIKPPGAIDATVIDTETTGPDSAVDEAIEIAGYRVVVGPAGILAVLGKIEMLEEPGRDISDGAFRTHHLSIDDLRGKRFDEGAVSTFINGADLVVAHNASFDYNILRRRFPNMEWPTWVCSQNDVPWNEKFGFSSRALEYLVMKAGLNYEAHRALVDTEALAETLTQHKVWSALRQASRMEHCVVWAYGSPFDASPRLKANGFYWNDPKNDNAIKGAPKAWYKRTNRADLPQLAEWMAEQAYAGNAHAAVFVTDLPGSLRFEHNFVSAERTQRVTLEDLMSTEEESSDTALAPSP
jgi:DNA polymerase-3 subunit epsilon